MPCRKKYSDEDIRNAVRSSYSVASVLRMIGLAPMGGNYKTFHSHVRRLELDTSHFTGKGHLKGKKCPWNFKRQRPLEEILVKDSTYASTNSLKKRLLNNKIIEEKCAECGIVEWQNKKLVLHLDHINGINDDHRLENLQLLCPNCHSQTSTYTGRNIGTKAKYQRSTKPKRTKKPRKKQLPKTCKDCNKNITQKSTRCKSCSQKQRPRIEWPTIKVLIERVEKSSYVAVGKSLGVSDNAVRKHIKNHSSISSSDCPKK